MVIIFSGFLIFYRIFPTPQDKWSVLISINNDIHELPDKLLNHVRLRIIENWEIPGKFQGFMVI